MKPDPNEAPIQVKEFRQLHKVSAHRMGAILGAMFPEKTGLRYIVASDVLKFMRAHVTLTVDDLHRLREQKLKELDLVSER